MGSVCPRVSCVVELVLGRVHHVLEHVHDVGAVAFRELQARHETFRERIVTRARGQLREQDRVPF